MARLMRAIRSGTASAAILLLPGAALAAPRVQDAQQVSADDRESPGDYDWIDRADTLWDAIGDAPPDYSFAFEDGEPWAWETADGYWVVVEDTPDGMRSYYFEPGAQGPFLTREAEHSFGYDDGAVAMIYDAGGGALARRDAEPFFDEGDRLYDRGAALLQALQRRDWQPVDTTAWIDTSFLLINLQNQWDAGRLRHPGWRRHRALPQVIAWHRRWDGEHRRRVDASERFRRWREGGYQGKPPGRPGGWVHGPKRPGRGDGRPGWQNRPPRGDTSGPDAIQDPALVVTPAGGGRRPLPGRPQGTPVQEPRIPDAAAPAVATPPRGPWRGGAGRPGGGRPDRPRPVPMAPAAPVVTPAPAPNVVTPAAPDVRPERGPRPGFRPRPSADGAPPRGEFPRPGRRPDGQAPSRPAFTPPSAPAAGAAPRPSYTPPPQRPAAAPAPRPAPPPRAAPPPRPVRTDRVEAKPE